MTHADAAFAGKIPEAYESQLVPILFEPYAADLADRLAKYGPSRVLELAAGTGALTRAVADRVVDVEIVATDISEAMLDKASHMLKKPNVTFAVADATALPFEDDSFDAVVCQFGVMFFPEKVTAYHHVHRVLKNGGAFVFNTWDGLFKNQMMKVIAKTFKENAGGQPCMIERVPFAYFEDTDIRNDLRTAGFATVDVHKVAKSTKVHSAAAVLDALVAGTPLGADFDGLGRDRGAHVREAVFEALTQAFGEGEFNNEMSALVVETKK